MFERTISIGSVGKTFSLTGWKVGWAVGPKELMRALWMVHQFIPFAVATPLQEATAIAFEQAAQHNYFETMLKGLLFNLPLNILVINNFLLDLERRRNLLTEVLDEVGLKPTVPDGSYFILADTSAYKIPAEFQDRRRDFNFCRWLTAKVGVGAIPPSAFYDPQNEHLPANYARFCFIKTDEMLNEAAKRLRAHFHRK